MAELNFPAAPDEGDIYNAPDGTDWEFDGVGWIRRIDAVAGDAIGTIKLLSGVPPAGWVVCDGSAYLQSSYPDALAEIGLLWRVSWTRQVDIDISSPSVARYLNGFFVIADSNSDARYSTDAVSWSTLDHNLSTGGYLRDICWTGTKYVAFGNEGGISNATTLSGTFTQRTSAFSAGQQVYCAASNGTGTVVGAGQYSSQLHVQRSTNNGDSWSNVTLPGTVPDAEVVAVIYAAGKFLLTAYESGQPCHLYVSSDGASWTHSSIGGDYEFYYPLYLEGHYYLAAATGAEAVKVQKSDDAATWTLLPTPAFPVDANPINNGVNVPRSPSVQAEAGVMSFVAGYSSGTGLFTLTDDFRVRLRQPVPPVSNAHGLIYGDDRIVLIGYDRDVWTSPARDYNIATEFIVPDLQTPAGNHSANYFIRLS